MGTKIAQDDFPCILKYGQNNNHSPPHILKYRKISMGRLIVFINTTFVNFTTQRRTFASQHLRHRNSSKQIGQT